MENALPPRNFGGLEGQTLEKALAVVLPVPYNGTNKWTTWSACSDKGPAAIIDASRNMELFDEELGMEVSRKGIFTLQAIKPAKKPEQVVAQVAGGVEKILAAKKFPLVLGGEHSITPGSVRAAKKFNKDLTVLQFDAHADLRNEFEGTKWSHACAARRILDEGARLVQVGTRSVCEEDWWFIEKARLPVFFA
ncbi:MAG: arginase family protein, partial [Candidatus Micrarchaeota archaeon]|nr:arginase family protein [Candidatus Micrarchaeota archaeon]